MAKAKKTTQRKNNNGKTGRKTSGKKTNKELPKTSAGSLLFKLLLTFAIIAGIFYSLFELKVEGKTPYSRIMKIVKSNRIKQDPQIKPKKDEKQALALKKEKKQERKPIVSKKQAIRKKKIMQAKTRNRSLEKVSVQAEQRDFINKKSISQKDKDNLNNLINSNL